MSISRKLLQTQPATGDIPIGGAYLQSTNANTQRKTWVCPEGVTSVSVLCIGRGGKGYWTSAGTGGSGGGGGGLAYINDFAVTPGQSYVVAIAGTVNEGSVFYNSDETVAYCHASAGRPGASGSTGGGAGGTAIVGIGYSGGKGGDRRGTTSRSGGGGGAAGYAGNGGAGLAGGLPGSYGDNADVGSGGGGGGGCAAVSDTAGSGGGVGAYGIGADGVGGLGTGSDGYPGTGGSGGNDGTYPTGANWLSRGGNFGGGGGGSDFGTDNREIGDPSFGIVRIIWPGNLRQFPSTDVDLASSIDGETLIV